MISLNHMNKVLPALALLVALTVGFFVFYQNRPAEQKTPATPETVREASSSQKWETKTEEQAGVTIVVTSLDLAPKSSEWKFDVGINTHSVELDQDMTKIVVLTDDQGTEYRPVAWDGAAPGGHHREGILTFKAISPMPQSIELTIKDIGGIPERSLKWDLK